MHPGVRPSVPCCLECNPISPRSRLEFSFMENRFFDELLLLPLLPQLTGIRTCTHLCQRTLIIGTVLSSKKKETFAGNLSTLTQSIEFRSFRSIGKGRSVGGENHCRRSAVVLNSRNLALFVSEPGANSNRRITFD